MKTTPQADGSVIHVVDDDSSFRRAIARVLHASGFTVREYASAGEFVLSLPLSGSGCLLLDVRMPGPSGLDLQDALARQAVRVPIIFLSGHGDIAMSVRAIKAGAVDFLTKPVKREALLAAVKIALRTDDATRAADSQYRALRERYEMLSARDREVLALVVAGRLNKQIAVSLDMAERTVKAHRAHIMQQMGADSVADLVRAADHLGIPVDG
jgi:FixJ family two-component response regulator